MIDYKMLTGADDPQGGLEFWCVESLYTGQGSADLGLAGVADLVVPADNPDSQMG